MQSESVSAEATGAKPGPMIMAPLRGITDRIYRTTFAEHFDGIDLAVAPFITTHAGRRIKPAHVRDLQPKENRRLPVIPQVLTKKAEDFILLADYLYDMGYGIINLNCGCPFPQVANKGRGCGLLGTPEALDRLLGTVLSHIPNRLSVKTRLGRYRADEIHAVLTVLNRYPLESVIIHPRTGIQMYGGTPDLEAFEGCLSECRHRVVYNGDITNLAAFQVLRQRFPMTAGWMIGRGLVADPFLPGMLKSGRRVGEPERTDRFRRFHDALFSGYQETLSGPGHLLDRMKGLWSYFLQSFRADDQERKRLFKARTIEQYREATRGLWNCGRHEPDAGGSGTALSGPATGNATTG